MPVVDETLRIEISKVIVHRDERQRREVKTDDLERSIKKIGQLQPIIVTRDLVLKAGERRLTACKNLGHSTILARFAEDLSPVESKIIELEENLKRTDLDWLDMTKAIGEIHGAYRALDPEWTMTETAAELSMSLGQCSMYLRVFGELEDSRVAKAGTAREAYNILNRREQRLQGDALQELLEAPEVPPSQVEADAEQEEVLEVAEDDLLPFTLPDKPYEIKARVIVEKPLVPAELPESILNESFLDWAPKYNGPKFNLVHCDFPYGVNLFDGPQGLGSEPTAGYTDTTDTYIALLDCLCRNLDNFMSVSGHLMFWYSAKHDGITREIFAKLAPTLGFVTFPLIWVKSDNAGIASDPRHGPRHVYETCLLASRNRRQIVRVVGDAYSCPTDKRLHVSTKPVSMLKHFMTMLVDETTTLLDPTCGSGAALRAAEELRATRVLGLEIDPKVCEIARGALRNDRLLRNASKAVK